MIKQVKNIGFSLPANSEYATVFVNHNGVNDNWGGQYSTSTRTIEFSTRFSGEYSIMENKANISDIGDLTEEQQRAIRFMVSKGYFNLEDDRFNGHAPLNRYDFTAALVKIFFALDRELDVTFSDVAKDSQYYPYVASGQNNQIIKGYDDNTFRGDLNITKEQIIAISGRTLSEKKGYFYPEDAKGIFAFVDSDKISDWAINDIAIAVEAGLIENGGILMPQMQITKSEAAEILYKLFMLLYETAPIEVEWDEVENSNSNILIFIIIALVAVAALNVIYIMWRKKKTVMTV